MKTALYSLAALLAFCLPASATGNAIVVREIHNVVPVVNYSYTTVPAVVEQVVVPVAPVIVEEVVQPRFSLRVGRAVNLNIGRQRVIRQRVVVPRQVIRQRVVVPRRAVQIRRFSSCH